MQKTVTYICRDEKVIFFSQSCRNYRSFLVVKEAKLHATFLKVTGMLHVSHLQRFSLNEVTLIEVLLYISERTS